MATPICYTNPFQCPFSPQFPLTADGRRIALSDRQPRSQVADAATATPHFDLGSGSDTGVICVAVTLLSVTRLRRCVTSLRIVPNFTTLSTHDIVSCMRV